MQDPLVYIVIVNYQQWEDSCECLASVFRSSFTNYRIILIDNNSPNDSMDQMVDWARENKINYAVYGCQEFKDQFDPVLNPPLVFLRNDRNRGFASGNNLAIGSLLDLDVYIWLFNPDMLADESTLEKLVKFAQQEKKQSVIGASVKSAKGNREILFYGGACINYFLASVRPVKTRKTIDKLDFISGTSLFTHASNFKTYGLLPEDYFLYWEEADWCHRARAMGAELKVCMEAVCYDKESTAIGKGFLAHYYYCRNGLLFISKYKKGNLLFALVSMGFRFLKRVFCGEWSIANGVYRGSIDFLKKRFHAIQ